MGYKIGEVTVDLKYYLGTDLYSDGDIENEILDIVKEEKDVLTSDKRWPILYHLSPGRKNLLEWYKFNSDSNLLEIGAGCGALTGLFCEKVKNVTAIELSKKRAEIIAHRHKQVSNLKIIVGNLNDITFDEKFDYITLIGVFEYAKTFTKGENPFIAFLSGVRKLLKPNGTLIIAIENRFGLKYWAGAREDHSGIFFDGIEGYLGNNTAITFGKNELTNLIKNTGFESYKYYYPMPDYKLPSQIFSDSYHPQFGQLGCSPNFDQDRLVVFNEKLVYNNLSENNMFDFFANSFLIFCGNGEKNEGDLCKV